MRFIAAGVIAIALLTFAAPAHAASPRRSAPPKHVEMIDEPLVIVGKLQKPQVFYVLSRHKLQYERMSLKRSFLPEIRRSVRSNPF